MDTWQDKHRGSEFVAAPAFIHSRPVANPLMQAATNLSYYTQSIIFLTELSAESNAGRLSAVLNLL
jgi:hypothetical protein